MAFGISKSELNEWKEKASNGRVSLLTHYWYDPRFPEHRSVTKAGCTDIDILIQWGRKYGLKEEWIHQREHFPHFDLLGDRQLRILQAEGKYDHIRRFILKT
ncbi:hypothetical protein [Alteribacillus sp. HJP-4]|uniref:hypothetical protein n=1 Tax=Alteribacillus sp. HJP-4 TaxID=2775394 RepID=UPI0035CCEF4C